MRLLLLADVHGNLEALEAVLADAGGRGYAETVFLGDAVGYGASSGEVVARLRALAPRAVMGNHEQMLLSGVRQGRFSDTPVGQALKLASAQLAPDDLEWLRTWKQGIKAPMGAAQTGTAQPGAAQTGTLEAFFVHGSPRDPNEYVDNLGAARAAFAQWAGKLAFVGHSHIAGVYAALERDTTNVRFTAFSETTNRLSMPPRGRWIVNPGSVGQPRDGDVRASYGIFDFARNALEVYRVAYDISGAQRRIREAGLPDALATRLSVGK